jgi:signal peptidase I
MEPTLLEGDQIVTLRESAYERGDVVVLRDPEDEKAYIVKRIMAVGGDTILVAGGAVYVNGSYVSEPYILSTPDYEMRTYSVPQGHVFFLGDNRNDSEDSHLWKDKARPVNEIIGKVRFIYFPFNRFGVFQGYPPVTPDRDVLEQRPGVL